MTIEEKSDVSHIPGRLDGKTCLITGANSGLGKALAVELARRGASILMGCRRNYADVQAEIQELSGSKQVSLRLLDLSSFRQVHRFCDELCEDRIHLDIVMLNAGMAATSDENSVDGFPLFWQVNYLSNALLLKRLLKDGLISNTAFYNEKEQSSGNSIPRIIFTSSSQHRGKLSIDFTRFDCFPKFSILDTFRYYGLSKLYLMTYAWELGRRLCKNELPECSVFAFCPGAFRSSIGQDLGFLGNLIMSTRPISPESASWPGIYLACSPELEGRTMIYYHKRLQEAPDPRAVDIENGKLVWEKTDQLLDRYYLAHN